MNTKNLNFADSLYKIFFIICIFISPLIFLTDFTRNPFNIQTFVLIISVAGMLAAWGVNVMLRREIIFKYTKADFWFLAFIAAALLSTALNILLTPADAPVLRGEFLRRGHVLFTNAFAAWFTAKAFLPYDGADKNFAPANWLFVWAALWLIYPVFKFDIYALLVWGAGVWLCFKHIRGGGIKEICDIFIAVAAIASAYGVLQNLGMEFLWHVDISYQFGARAVSTFGNPNFLSSYITLVLPLALVYFLKAKDKPALFYYFGIIILFAIYLAISATRSSWLGAGAGMVVLFLFKDLRELLAAAKKRAALIFVCAVLAFSLWNGAAAITRAGETGFLAAPSLSADAGQINQAWHQRVMMWNCALKAAKKSPLIGGGWGSYQFNYAECQGQLLMKYPRLAPLRTQANAAHNELAEVLAQTGILGLMLYIVFYAALLFAFAKKYKDLQPSARIFYAALLAGTAGMFADNMLNITLQTSVLAFAFWFILSSINCAPQKTVAKKINAVLGAVIFIVCLAAAVILSVWQFGKIKADAAEFKSYKFLAQNNFKAAAFAAQDSVKTIAPWAESYYSLINSYMKSGDNAAALAAAKDAVKQFPHYHEFHFRLAALRLAGGQQAEAAENLAGVLRLYPGYYPAARAFALLLAENKDFAAPANIELLEAALAAMPYASDIKLNLARVHGDANIAAEVLRADNLDPDALALLASFKLDESQSALLKKAQTAQTLKKLLPQKSGAEVRAFYQSNPGDLAAAMIWAEYNFKNNRSKEAAEILLEVYPQNKNNAALNFALASVYSSLNEPQKAAVFLETILAQNPFNETAQRRLSALR